MQYHSWLRRLTRPRTLGAVAVAVVAASAAAHASCQRALDLNPSFHHRYANDARAKLETK